ncbi:MAG: hypothetical protein JWN10_1967 [Solirubrobacterales bacterium]|nr:hypothetical protein [Solirubrobacterales bacterium]
MGDEELSGGTSDERSAAAPRWRRTLAGASDAAIVGAFAWVWSRRADRTDAGPVRWGSLLADLSREQLRTPGERMLGLRTVDPRTGRRPELWRTLVVRGVGVGGRLLVRRMAPGPTTSERQGERDAFLDELNAIQQRHCDAPAAREAERRALFERNHSPRATTLARALGPTLALGLLNSRLRRHFAPTIQVPARRGKYHNP